MTAFDYAAARDDADALLTEFGAPSALRRVSNTGGTAFEPVQTTTDYPTSVAVVNLTRWYPAYVNNSDVLRTDRRGLVAAGPLTALGVTQLLPFDTIIFGGTWDSGTSKQIGGKTYRIIDAKPIEPGTIPVFYDLQLRV